MWTIIFINTILFWVGEPQVKQILFVSVAYFSQIPQPIVVRVPIYRTVMRSPGASALEQQEWQTVSDNGHYTKEHPFPTNSNTM